jgi:uncharacterized RDD family membrane protein YckC
LSDTPQTQPPGWYYAQGDPPNTQRYWDGTQWQGGPQPIQGAGQAATAGGAGGGQGDLASPWSRLGARILDGLILLIPNIIIAVVLGAGAYGLGGDASFGAALVAGIIGTFIGLAYEFYFLTKDGATIGKKALNIKVVQENGADLDQEVTIRRLILPALNAIPVIGPLINAIVGLATAIMIFVDDRRQVPHDKIAKTLVVRT